MKKRILSVLITLAMLVGLVTVMGISASADTVTYDLWVGGEQFTSEKLTVTGGDGTATYDPDTNTLTLDNYSYTGAGHVHQNSAMIFSELSDTLNIVLKGINTLTGQNNSNGIHIYRNFVSLRISDFAGDDSTGVLNIESNLGILMSGGSCLTLDDVTLNIKSAWAGINCPGGTLYPTNSTVTITSTNSNAVGELSEINFTDGAANYNVYINQFSAFSISDADKINISTYQNNKYIKIAPLPPAPQAITAGTATNGTFTVSERSASKGTEITVTATPDTGYTVGAVKVYKTGDKSTTVTVTDGKFIMPNYPVTVSVTFAKAYDLWVGGVQVTSANKDNIVVPGATGSATYDPATSTLTLDNFSYTGEGKGFGYGNRIAGIGSQLSNLTILLKGENTINTTSGSGVISTKSFSISDYTGDSSVGSLCVTSPSNALSWGILTIAGVNVTAISTEEVAIYLDELTITDANVSATGLWGGLSADEYINITNSVVEASVTPSDRDDDFAFDPAPTITGNYTVYAGNDADSAVKVNAPTDATYAKKYVRIEPVKYDLYIGGVQFTSANLVIDGTDSAAISGSATYNPELNTLTLNNFQYSGPGYQHEEYGYLYGALRVEGDNDLCIVFTGQNVIECTEGEEVWGLYTDFNGDLHIKAETIDSCLTFIGDVACGRVPLFDGNFVIYAGDNEADAKITAEDTFASQYYTYSYVRYEPTLMITFDYGTLGSETKTFLNGETVTPPAPVFAGKVFAGWYDDAACTQPHDFSTPFTANDTIYAKYVNIPKRSRVSFVADGRLVGIILYRPSQTELTTVPKVPAKEGYVGTWETYTLNGKNMIVRAVYTPIN